MPACEYVTLRGGFVVPADTLRRVWALEERGVIFRLDGDGVVVGPSRLLDESDTAFLREHKATLITILAGETHA
jgi:hypothetical protein